MAVYDCAWYNYMELENMPNNIYNNLSEEQLRAGYWYVTHRVILRKLGIFVLALVAGGLLLFGAHGLIKYYLADRVANRALESDIAKSKLDYQLLAEMNTPKDLHVLETQVIKTGSGSFDLITEIVNSNVQWMVESFDYYFIMGEQKTNVKTGFVLPEEDKYVMYLNYKTDRSFSSANIVIENIKWKKTPNYGAMREKILQFGFENPVVLASSKSGISEAGDVANISFDVLNKSAYNFWEPKFTVLLYKGDKLAAITSAVIDSLSSGEKRSVSINLFQSLPRGVEMQILSDINILDPNVFKGFDYSQDELQ